MAKTRRPSLGWPGIGRQALRQENHWAAERKPSHWRPTSDGARANKEGCGGKTKVLLQFTTFPVAGKADSYKKKKSCGKTHEEKRLKKGRTEARQNAQTTPRANHGLNVEACVRGGQKREKGGRRTESEKLPGDSDTKKSHYHNRENPPHWGARSSKKSGQRTVGPRRWREAVGSSRDLCNLRR